MSKDLKRFSRVELLELLIDLSEDYETLARENRRLKKALSGQRLPRSAKVGSIAEASLAVNGYFEAAQRSADGYLREIKRLRDELARRVEAQKHMEAQNAQDELERARRQARQIVERADLQAEAMLSDARKRAREMLSDAERNAESGAMLRKRPLAIPTVMSATEQGLS